MRSIAGKLYQRVNLLTLSLVLATSGISVAVPLFLSQNASAVTSSVVYDGIPANQPSSYASLGYEATSTKEFGDELQLAGTSRHLNTVTVSLTDWACENDYTKASPSVPCVTTPGATFIHPITLNIYKVSGGVAGSQIATKTQNVAVPYRPSADPTNCVGPDAGKWFDGTECNNGFAFDVTFDFSAQSVTLPSDLIATIAYNTQSYGVAPTGEPGPYNSLNASLAQTAPTTGTDVSSDDMFWDTTYPGYSGGLKLDTGWTPYHLAIRINATQIASPANLSLQNINGAFTCGGSTNINSITPIWNAVPGANSYNYKVTLPGGAVYGPVNVGNVTSITGPFGAQGTSSFSVQAVDAYGSVSEWATPCAVTYDIIPPTTPVNGLPNNTSIPTNSFDFTWDASSDSSPLTYEFQSSLNPDQNIGVLTTGVWHSGTLASPTIHSTGAPDGTWYWQVRAKDAAGNYSPWSTIWNVTLDMVAPTAHLIFSVPGPSATGFKVQFSEAVNVVDAENSANYSLNNWPGAGGSGTLSGHANVSYDAGTKTATVIFTTPGWSISAEQQWGVENIRDLAGNLLALNPTKDYSTPMENPTAPGAPTATSPTNNKTITWSWSPATDPGGVNASGVKGYYYTLTSGVTTVIGSTFTSNPTATTTVPADGTYTLNVHTIDNAGNVSGTVSGQVIVDTIAPMVTIDASANTANNKPTITGTIDDHTATVSLDIDGTPFVATNNGNSTWTYTVTTALSDGTHTLTATGTDTAGNTTTPVSTGSILVDTTGPVVTIADAAPITTGSVTPAVTAADVSAPLTYLWTASLANPAVISFTNNIAQPTFTPTAAGTYSFTLLTTDALGNLTTKTFGFTYTLPVVNPNGTTPSAIVVTPQPTNNNLGAPAVLGATTDTTQTPAADVLGAPDVKGVSTQLATTTTPSSSSTGLAWYWWVLIVAAAVSFVWWLIARLRNRTNVA